MMRFRFFSLQVFTGCKYNYCASYSTSNQHIKEEKMKVAKWHINYVKVGSGPHTVLCMPGALGTIWTDFRPQIEGFDREKFTVIVWDPPGYGGSRPPNKVFTTDCFEKDAECASEFMKALQIPRYSILGWSAGSITSLIHAAKYPVAMVKLVVFGTCALILPQELKRIQKMRDISTWSEKMKKAKTEVYGDYFPKYWSDWIDLNEALLKANDGNICTHLLKDIQCPTFILYGEKDPLIDPVHAPDLLTKISDSKLHLYPDGKHNIHLQYADDFNKRVQDFLLKA